MEVRGMTRTYIVPMTDVARHISSLGALVTVLALAIDPFAQQVACYEVETSASSQNSTLPVRFYFADDIDATFRGASYAGLFGSGQNTLNPHCSSGNCTWAPYRTLALCSQCIDVTSLVKATGVECDIYSITSDHGKCSWSLPNGLSLKVYGLSKSNMNMSGILPPMMLDKVGHAVVNFSLLDITNSANIWAAECSLYWCINTYTATLNNGRFAERLESSWYNATSALPLANIPIEEVLDTSTDSGPDNIKFYNTTPPTGGAKSQPNLNLSVDEMEFQSNDIVRREDFLVTNTPEVLEWLGGLLSGTMSYNNRPSTNVVDVFYDTHGGPSTSPGASDANPTISVVQDIFDRLAQSLSIWIRTSQGTASFDLSMGQAVGVTWTSETILKVRWAWLALPCVLQAGTLVFLCFTIIGARKKHVGIWKSTSLALLFHGLGERSAEGMEDLGHVVEMEAKSGRTWVRLEDDGAGARLVERSGLP